MKERAGLGLWLCGCNGQWWHLVAFSPCCWQCRAPSPPPPEGPFLTGTGPFCPSLLPPQGRDEWVLGWKQKTKPKTLGLRLSLFFFFKEHLISWQSGGPGVAGGAAGSARRRHGRVGCAFRKERETTKKQPASPSLRALCFPGWSLGRDTVSRLHRVPSAPTRAKGEEKAAETRGHREEPTGRNSAQQSQVLLLLSSTGGAAQSQRAQDTRDPKPRMFTKQEHKEQHNAG